MLVAWSFQGERLLLRCWEEDTPLSATPNLRGGSITLTDFLAQMSSSFAHCP